jgi:hypothetical protein
MRAAVALTVSLCALSACSTRAGIASVDGDAAASTIDAAAEGAVAETASPPDAEVEAEPVIWPHGIQAFDATLTGGGGSVRVLTGPFDGKDVPVAKVQPFTLVFDPDARLVYVRYAVYPVTSTDGRTFHVQGTIELQTTPDEPLVRHKDLFFTIDGGKLAGGAHDEATTAYNFESSSTVDLGSSILAGGPDVTPPHVWWYWPKEDVDPFFGFGLFVSEALTGSSAARLVGSMGDSVTFPPYDANTGGRVVAIWDNPKRVLRYGATYHLDSTTMLDFAGHELEPFEIKTQPLPPLITPDGFESAPLGPFAGGEVIGAPSMTSIAGAKSFFVKASCTTPSQIIWSIPSAVFRVPVTANAKVLSISYRVVSSVQPKRVYTSAYVGVEGGGEPLAWSLDGETMGATGVQVTKPLLPAGATTEVVVVVRPAIAGCPLPAGPDGVLIDDVHAE